MLVSSSLVSFGIVVSHRVVYTNLLFGFSVYVMFIGHTQVVHKPPVMSTLLIIVFVHVRNFFRRMPSSLVKLSDKRDACARIRFISLQG